MKRILILFYFVFLLVPFLFSQQSFSKLHFSGYKVIIIPSDEFSLEIKNPDLGIKTEEGNSLSLEIKDQNGRVPKDTVIIHTNRVDHIYLHNSGLVMDQCLKVDSIDIKAVSSYGKINVSSNYLSVNLSAGSRFEAVGQTKYWACQMKAASKLNSNNLIISNIE